MENQRKSDYFFHEDNWETVCLRIASSDKLALFLDFDGTLVPIQEDPSSCVLAGGIKQQLKSLVDSCQCYIAILSGRSLPDIKNRVGIPNICYGGNHGLVISGRDMTYVHARALLAKPSIDKAARMFSREIIGIDGAWVEKKKFTVSVHYRLARKEDIHSIREKVYKIVSALSKDRNLAIIKGKMVYELVPDASWTKGTAALWILQKLAGRYLPIYVGDDITDESVFKAFQGKGITVRVGRSIISAADYHLKGQKEVSRFLQYVLDALKPQLTGIRSL